MPLPSPLASIQPMRLQGSCHCGAVRFALESDEAVPFQHCYCSICRKLGGGGGYLINLGGRAETLVVEGQEQVKVYRARIPDGAGHRISAHERHFCSQCGAHLWAFHPDWPELIHPVAGAIDSELPAPPQHRHMMVGSKASWVPLWAGPDDGFATGYPDSSLADWHSAHDAASLAPTVHPPPATGNEAIHIYHIAQGADWHAAQALGEYRTASLESDGFIHCSTRPQVLPTAHRYFLGQRNGCDNRHAKASGLFRHTSGGPA